MTTTDRLEKRVPLLDIQGVTKSFPGSRALDAVSFKVASGEIVAVVGQNGSGKSTLVKTLSGLHEADPGSAVSVRGERLALRAGASPEGLHFIHQDLGLVSALSTVENLNLSEMLGAGGWLPYHRRREVAHARALIARFGASFDVEMPVGQLSAEERTIVAIARALDDWKRPDEVLVLDEPTAALEREEVRRLFTAVTRVASQGAGVIFISHRLDEILDLAHRVVALRDGRVVADLPISQVDHTSLIRAIAGRAITDIRRTPGRPDGEVVLDCRGVGGATVASVDLTLRAGEIVGICGILGSGRESLNQVLFGALPRAGGSVEICGDSLRAGNPGDSIRKTVAFVPADRHEDGAFMEMSMRENLTLPSFSDLVGSGGRLKSAAERTEARAWAQTLELRPPEPERHLGLFSGGNQQKVVIGMRLRTNPRVLLLDEPTQGVDVGAKASLYELMAGAARDGAGVLISSSDTKELTLVCDRVIVMRDGLVAAELSGERLNEEELVRESLGLSSSDMDKSFSLQAEVADE